MAGHETNQSDISIRLMEECDAEEAEHMIYRLIYTQSAMDFLTDSIFKKRYLVIFTICGILGYMDLGLVSEAFLCFITPICMLYLAIRYLVLPREYKRYLGNGGDLFHFWSQPNRRLWVAEVDGKLAGTIAVDETTADTCQIYRVCVKKRYRGLGIARQMVQTLMRYVETRGYDHVILGTSHIQVPAQKMYEKQGFSVVNCAFIGQFPKYYFGYTYFLYHMSPTGKAPGVWTTPEGLKLA